jgi:cupredoxin-like protein
MFADLPPQPVAAEPATAVGIGEREWRITLYRSKVPAGRVAFNVRNFGEDGHDLAVRTASGRVLGALDEVSPGDTARLSVRLRKPGRYRLFCTLEGHEAKGMRALLRVKRRQ